MYDDEVQPNEAETNRYKVEKLALLCATWGVQVVEKPEEEIRKIKRLTFYHAPFTSRQLGVDYKRREVYYAPGIPWPHVLHEMGHASASRRRPSRSDEWKFFGWEYLMAQYVDGVDEWVKSNESYQVDDGSPGGFAELRDVSAIRLQELIREAIELGTRYGNINAKGNPCCVRRKRKTPGVRPKQKQRHSTRRISGRRRG